MSEPPPPGSAEPVPPVDPIRPASPAAGPPPQRSGPSGPPTSAAGQPAVDPWAAAGPSDSEPDIPPPGYAAPPGSPWAGSTPDASPQPGWPAQPGGPDQSAGTPPGWPAQQGTPPGWSAPQGTPPGGLAPQGTPSGWAAPQGTPPGGPAQQGMPSGWPAPQGTPPGWPAQPGTPSGWAAPDAGGNWAAGGPAYPGHPMPGATYPALPVPGGPPGWYPGLVPNDPLVTLPHEGVGGWFARCVGAVRRGWRQLLPIMLLTQVVPAAVISVLSLFLVPSEPMGTGPDGAPVLPDGYLEQMLAFYGVVLLAALVFSPLQALGWGAGTWVVARQAAGEPAGVGGALRYGLRRALGLWGWTIVVSLLITVGACLCLLPGIYAGFAVALFGPVHLFERQDPLGRAWRMFHRRFGMVLGRVALVVCALLAVSVLDFVVGLVSSAVFGTDPTAAPGTAAGAVTLALIGTVLATPAYVAQLVGLVVAYAEQRAQEGPVNAARLAAELG
ncbi:hypothetical protein [Micromonospora robiginosa]|uniref:Uncharacterized protein n=1 Tax=Micromonospora robiginosa TaxID=2749844 RepID=A0A7L6B875_9ACTN|nr:hypothetical protein [Micromonospora ferruginea]QLQ38176.1 hypothetical protein H1D33_04635 [Micromonospora ferruginea]